MDGQGDAAWEVLGSSVVPYGDVLSVCHDIFADEQALDMTLTHLHNTGRVSVGPQSHGDTKMDRVGLLCNFF